MLHMHYPVLEGGNLQAIMRTLPHCPLPPLRLLASSIHMCQHHAPLALNLPIPVNFVQHCG